MHMTLPLFAQSLGGRSLTSFSRWGDTPSIRSVAGGTLPYFVQSLGRRSFTSFSCWGMLSHFVQSLGGRSLTSFSRWGDAPSLRSVTGGTLPRFAQSLGVLLASLRRFPLNCSIKMKIALVPPCILLPKKFPHKNTKA